MVREESADVVTHASGYNLKDDQELLDVSVSIQSHINHSHNLFSQFIDSERAMRAQLEAQGGVAEIGSDSDDSDQDEDDDEEEDDEDGGEQAHAELADQGEEEEDGDSDEEDSEDEAEAAEAKDHAARPAHLDAEEMELYAAEWAVPANDNHAHRAFRDVPHSKGPGSVASQVRSCTGKGLQAR